MVVRADDERDVPARAQLGVVHLAGGRLAVGASAPASSAAPGLRVDAGCLAGLQVETHAGDLLGAGIDDAGIFLVGARLVSIAAAGIHPVAGADAGRVDGARGNALGAVVLRAAVDVVKRQPVVHRHAVELGHRNVVEVPPRAPVVVAFVEPAVVAFDQVILVRGVEHQRVVIGVQPHSASAAAPAAEGVLHRLAAVLGQEHRLVHGVDAVELERIGEDFAVIFGILHFLVGAAGPMLAAVLAAVVARHLVSPRGHDQGVHHVGLLRRDGQGDAAHVHGGQAFRQFLPGLAAVGSFENARVRTAGHHHAGIAPALVGGGVHHVGVARVDIDVGDAGVLGDFEDGLPGRAAVGGLVETAVAAGRE